MAQQPLAALRVSNAALLSLLKKTGKITAEQAGMLQKQQRTSGSSIQHLAIQHGFITESGIAKLYAVEPNNTKSELLSTTSTLPHLSGTKLSRELLSEAIRRGAFFIHIDPVQGGSQVRLRIDGSLILLYSLPARPTQVLLAYLKTQANLSATGHSYGQHGTYTFENEGDSYRINVAIMPTERGEKATLAITPLTFLPRSIAELGYWGDNQKHLHDGLAHLRGLVVISGPHIAGLTTTFLNALHMLGPDLTTVTLEDSVSQQLPHATQTTVRGNGELFRDQLLALRRHDPDVIGIDQAHDTAALLGGVQMAVDGHLVLLTMGGTNTSDAIHRILAAGADPYTLATCLRVVSNQRLARRLCTACKLSYRPKATELRHIMQQFGVSNATHLPKLYALQKAAAQAFSVKHAGFTNLYTPSEKGCDACNFSGYKGFIGLNEVLSVGAPIQKFITAKADVSTLQRRTTQDGVLPIRTDALIKIFLGLTSIDEALRVL